MKSIDVSSSSTDSETNVGSSSTDSESSNWDVDTYKALNDSVLGNPVITRVLPQWACSSVSTNTGSHGSTKRSLPSNLNKKSSHTNDYLDQKSNSSKIYRNGKWYTVKHDNHNKASSNHGSESDNVGMPMLQRSPFVTARIGDGKGCLIVGELAIKAVV